MAASTSSSTLTIKTQTPDPFFSYIQESKEALFNQTEKNFEAFYSQWEKEYDSLEQFQVSIRKRGSEFQNEKVKPLPKKEELEKEREGYLTQYWAFKGTCEKIALYSSELTRRIEFLTPAHVRKYGDEERLKNEQPEFLERMKKHEEICKVYIEKVQKFSAQIITLKGKFFVCIHNDTYNVNWALQRFCQIVDNQGRPLSGLTRFADNLATAVIPKPKGPCSMSESTASVQQATVSSSEKSNEASSPQVASPQPQAEASSTQKEEAGKETPNAQSAPPPPQPRASSTQKKGEDKETLSSQAATPPPRPQASSSPNKEAPTPSSATTMTDTEMRLLNQKPINDEKST